MSEVTQVATILDSVADRFSKSFDVAYEASTLWEAIEWWRSKVFERFTAAGFEGRTTNVTAYWTEGGHADRPIAKQLREFGEAEHLEARSLRCTMRNAKFPDDTIEISLRADFVYTPGISVEIEGDVKQQVYGLHAELLLEKQAEEARVAQAAEDKAKREAEAKAASAPTPPASSPEGEPKSGWGRFAKVVAVLAGLAGILTFLLKVTGVF